MWFYISVIVAAIIATIYMYVRMFMESREVIGVMADNQAEFNQMEINDMYNTILNLQRTGQYHIGQQYLGGLSDPVTDDLRDMAASEGVELDF